MKRIQDFINRTWQDQDTRDTVEDAFTVVVMILFSAALWWISHTFGLAI